MEEMQEVRESKTQTSLAFIGSTPEIAMGEHTVRGEYQSHF